LLLLRQAAGQHAAGCDPVSTMLARTAGNDTGVAVEHVGYREADLNRACGLIHDKRWQVFRAVFLPLIPAMFVRKCFAAGSDDAAPDAIPERLTWINKNPGQYDYGVRFTAPR
jgi:hypothetical protein